MSLLTHWLFSSMVFRFRELSWFLSFKEFLHFVELVEIFGIKFLITSSCYPFNICRLFSELLFSFLMLILCLFSSYLRSLAKCSPILLIFHKEKVLGSLFYFFPDFYFINVCTDVYYFLFLITLD